MHRLFAVVPLMVLALPLAPAAPGPLARKKPTSYFPAQKGARWVYQDGDEELTLMVTAVQEKGDQKVVTVSELLKGGKEEPREKVAVSQKGLFKLEGVAGKPDAPLCLLKLPAKPGETWDFHLKGPFPIRDEKGTMTAHQPEEVKVPAGKFKAVRVEVQVTAINGEPLRSPRRATYWLAPDVGLVKLDSHNGGSIVLKSFTPGKK